MRANPRNLLLLGGVTAFLVPVAFSQESKDLAPRPYRGVEEHVDGVFVTPVSGAPFTAVVEIESTLSLQDGTTVVKKTINNVARDSTGRIYNERRRMMPSSFTGTPPLLRFHIYDPSTRQNTFLDPFTRLAHQSILTAPDSTSGPIKSVPGIEVEDLGTNVMENLLVQGRRISKTISPKSSGTSKEIVVTDEYWYSEDLQLNMLVVHKDPRTGQQTVTITKLNREEPAETVFQIPSGYRLVDENPEPQQAR
jgi:hypothetical protein